MKKLFLVDDHKMLRKGIASYITENSDWEIAGEAESCEELSSLIENLKTELAAGKDDTYVAVVDIQLKGDGELETNGFNAVRQLRKLGIPAVVFSSHDTGSVIQKAISPEVGARGFVSKCSDEKMLLDALNTIASGKSFVQPDLITGLLETRSVFSVLTKREHQIVDLMLQGIPTEKIAEELGIKPQTISNYLCTIYDKLGCKNRTDLIEKMR